MTDETVRLSVGASSGQRVFAAMVGLLVAALGAAFVLLPLVTDGPVRRVLGADDPLSVYREARDLPPGLLPPELRDSPAAGGGAGRLLGLCGVPFVLLGLYLVLRVLRTAAWLTGTRVTVRGALGTRTVDLATAGISTGTLRHRDADLDVVHRIPAIVARDPGTGRAVTVPLRGPGPTTLPPYQLRALADAISAGRPTDGPDGDRDVVAGRLRAMAADPLGP